MTSPRVVALSGGVGAARFLQGLVRVVPPECITAIVNTGDDSEFYGLHVSPDIDIVLYTLAGLVDSEQGWGVVDDTFNALQMLEQYGLESWFRLGDRDLATQIHRTELLRGGQTLSQVTDHLRNRLNVTSLVVPMSDQPVRTWIRTPEGWLPFQEYFVKRRTADDVLDIEVRGAAEACPAPEVIEALDAADRVVICPSNPLVSIGTILAVPGIRDALRRCGAPVVAISPIVGGATLKGPADRMMRAAGMEVSAVGVARAYADFLDVMVLDEQDRTLAPRVESLGIRAVVTDTIMRDLHAKERLAWATLAALGSCSRGRSPHQVHPGR